MAYMGILFDYTQSHILFTPYSIYSRGTLYRGRWRYTGIYAGIYGQGNDMETAGNWCVIDYGAL